MRWVYIILLPAILILLSVGLIYQHKDKATIIKTPPKALAKWYKPESKRHVWLHNMFKLRREMQAVQFYAQAKHDENLQKWGSQLNQHYLKIGEMVPEWQKKLDVDAMNLMQKSIATLDYTGVIASVDKVQASCDSCHDDYQAITALTYRAPNFNNMKVTDDLTFTAHMDKLSKQVNQIKIAAEDGMLELAQSSLNDLKSGMNELGQVCVDCHKKDRKPYPSEQMSATIASLEQNLTTGTLKQQSRDLGTLAVLACAQCHGTHRLAFGAKELLSREPSLEALLKH